MTLMERSRSVYCHVCHEGAVFLFSFLPEAIIPRHSSVLSIFSRLLDSNSLEHGCPAKNHATSLCFSRNLISGNRDSIIINNLHFFALFRFSYYPGSLKIVQ